MERERGGKEEPATPDILDKMLSVNDCEFPQFRAEVWGLELGCRSGDLPCIHAHLSTPKRARVHRRGSMHVYH